MAKQTEEDYVTIHRVADRKAPLFRQAFFDSFGKFSQNIDAETMESLIKMGAFDALNVAIPWEELRRLLREGFDPPTVQAIVDSADKSSNIVRRTIEDALGVKVSLSFDSTSSRVRSYLQSEIGTLITEMTKESQAVVRRMILDAQINETSASRLIRDLKRNIGLRSDQYRALSNYTNNLRKNTDLKASRVTELSNQYRDRLLGQRASLIADTESMVAANFGFQEGYNQAADQGLIDRNRTTKEWVVTPDDRLCPTCAPMSGNTIPLNSSWIVTIYQENSLGTVPKGQKIVNIPNRIHPRCRCAMKINPAPR
jgi:type IV pilus biogenesis protein CpaD/CtpE